MNFNNALKSREMCVYSAGQMNYKALSLPLVKSEIVATVSRDHRVVYQIQNYFMPGKGKEHIVDIHYI